MDFKSLSEKTAYLRGLMKGLKTDDEVICLIAEILSDMAHQIEQTHSDMGELAELVDDIDKDLGEIEGDFYETDPEDGEDFEEPADEELFEEEEMYEVTCPTCGDTISLNEGMIAEGTITCPRCGELLEFDLDQSGDDEDEDA